LHAEEKMRATIFLAFAENKKSDGDHPIQLVDKVSTSW